LRDVIPSYLISLLLEDGSMTRVQIENKTFRRLLRFPEFLSILESLTEIKESGQRNNRLLKDEVQKHFIYPWISHAKLLRITTRLLSKSQTLTAFPKLENDPMDLSLRECLFQPMTFAIEYHILNTYLWKNNTQQIASVHLAFGLLKITGQAFRKEIHCQEYPIIKAGCLSERCDRLSQI
jgi:hypothetical protein